MRTTRTNPVLASRQVLKDRFEARRNFQERHVANELGRRRLVGAAPSIVLGEPQDIVYYDALSFVVGYGSAYMDTALVAARFDELGRPVAHQVRDTDSHRVLSPDGQTIAHVAPIAAGSGVLVMDERGDLCGIARLIDSCTSEARDADGRLVARAVYGPDRAVWLDALGRTLGRAYSRVMSGAWLATEDAWHLFIGPTKDLQTAQ